MHTIWERNLGYNLLHIYADLCTRLSYRKMSIEGEVPRDGRAMIITPNHTNTLMDAMVILQCSRKPTAFGCRADVFNNPKVARILRFLRMVPITRERDGLRNVAQNLEVMPDIYEVMHHGLPFCIFPEGRHRAMYSLLPIRKGAVRLAVGNAAGQTTCIVPVGIEYSDFFHYRSSCKVRIGEPIDVSAFLAANPELKKAEVYNRLNEQIREALSRLFLCLPDDENYEAALAAARPPRKRRWWEWPLAVFTSPFFALSAVLTASMWGTGEFICHRKIKDPAFRNTVRYAVKVVGTPLLLLVWALLFFLLLPPPGAAALLLYFLPSYSIFYDWLNLVCGRL